MSFLYGNPKNPENDHRTAGVGAMGGGCRLATHTTARTAPMLCETYDYNLGVSAGFHAGASQEENAPTT